ncbi:MAG: prepilin-type N-terminal cleavage/methylation domain-containing protein [Lachnospiraceae bacterium]|nr:prepilin-type N-terminal cleavage/methylation domain-containing protein [Lachnospiraceae bacterium]
MVKQKLNNKGFTFVELVLAVAILSVVMVSIVQFMTSTSRVYSRSNHNNEVQSIAQDVYEQVSTCIMQANKVMIYGLADGETDKKLYVSESMDPIAEKAVRMDPATGRLCDNKEKVLKYSVQYWDANQALITLYSGGEAKIPLYAFRYLKQDTDGDGVEELTNIKVDFLYIEYQTKNSTGGYENCCVTFAYNDTNKKLYLNRHCASDSTIGNYVTSVADIGVYPDGKQKESGLLCKVMDTDGFRVVVDAENNSIGLIMNFDNYSLTYDSQGMIKIRNKDVLMK